MADKQVEGSDPGHSTKREFEHGNTQALGHQFAAVSLGGNASAHLGDVNHFCHVGRPPQGQTQPFLRPSIVIPFRRDRDFVERNVLDEIFHRICEPAARVGLVGLGGVGKTQIAIEYAYRRRKADQQLWVFWVHASSAARFEESYRQIAQQVHLDGWADPKTDILPVVRGWLSDEHNGQWTMVLDNADSTEVMFGSRRGEPVESATSNNRSLIEYLPSAPHGSIVVTSRSREVAEGIAEYPEDVIDVAPMTEEEAVSLLGKKLKLSESHVEWSTLGALVQELDHMPLAIAQAASYINQVGARMTASRYLEMLVNSNADRDRLLHKDIRDSRRDGHSSNSIIVTWHTSFEHIRNTQPSAARLLALMSLFDREGIPESLLQGHYSPEDESHLHTNRASGSIQDDYSFDEDLAMLKAYSLVSVGTDNQLFDMHRLVQFSTRKWLELHGELVYWQCKYIHILYDAFPIGKFENWPACSRLFPHVEMILSYRVEAFDFIRERAEVLYRGAWYADSNGRYEVALELGEEALKDQEHCSDPGSIPALNTSDILARILRNQGKFDKAENLFRQTLAGREKVLGSDHIDTLTSLHQLALVLRNQGQYEESEALYRRALEGTEKTLGPSHPETLASADNLAALMTLQGQYKQAEELHRWVLIEREQLLGPLHPETLTSIDNLGSALLQQGQYKQAEELHRRAVVGREQVLGLNHRHTLVSVSKLADALEHQKLFKEAEELYRQALTGFKKELGDDHPTTLISLSNLALSFQDQGQYEQAEELFRQVVTGLEKVLGTSHPETLESVYSLARSLQLTKNFSESLRLFDRVVSGSIDVFGTSHPDVLFYQKMRRELKEEMDLP